MLITNLVDLILGFIYLSFGDLLNILCFKFWTERSVFLDSEVLRNLGAVWYMCLKTKNCCLKTFVKIRVGEKVR